MSWRRTKGKIEELEVERQLAQKAGEVDLRVELETPPLEPDEDKKRAREENDEDEVVRNN